MRLLRSAYAVARLEAGLFRAYPKLRLSVLGIVLIPALYAYIYLSSVWDPVSRTGQLAAAVVDLDRGAQANGQPVNLGAELARTLKQRRIFGFYDEADAEHAKREVRAGRALFALIIPPDFSANAVSAAAPGAGRLVVYASEGNNYAGAGFAKRFAIDLGHQINETLNEKRWTAVLGATSASADGLTRLRQGIAALQGGAQQLEAGSAQAHAGSARLAAGAGRLAGGMAALADGVNQLAAGARTLEGRRPAAADLQALKAGAQQLAAGHDTLRHGLGQLEDGARRLAQGAGQLHDQTEDLPFVGERIGGAAGQLQAGAVRLQEGLRAAGDGTAQLAAGSQGLREGVERLADGFAAYGFGVATLAAKFPPEARLDELNRGAHALADAGGQLDGGLQRLHAGAGQLARGLDTLASALPREVPGLPGTPQGLATSVAPQVEIDAPVINNGLGFAPNFIPVALWLGAVMAAFVFHLRRLPEAARGHGPVALLLGKMGVLGSINLAQAAVVLAMCAFLLGLHPAHVAGLALTMAVSALTFMLILLGLVRAFGDTGKALALILLILQLSSAGGLMPIELTNDFFRAVSPWLPFTWAVKAVRASAFGAFGSEWGSALGVLALFGAGAFVVATFVGRWKFVPPQEHRPAMDM